MKEIKVILGIILITIGGIVFEIGQNYVEQSITLGNIVKLFSLIIVGIGVIICILVVDSIDETKKKRDEKEIYSKTNAKRKKICTYKY